MLIVYRALPDNECVLRSMSASRTTPSTQSPVISIGGVVSHKTPPE